MDRARLLFLRRGGAGALAGFTLVEVIVTIALAAVLLSIATPSLRSFLLDSSRTAAVNEFLAALNYARFSAIGNRGSVSICRSSSGAATRPACARDGGWEQGWLIFRDENADGVFDSVDQPLRQREALGRGATLHGNSKVVSRITFRGSGITANNGRLVFCDSRGWSDAARIVVIAVSGRVRVTTRAEDSKPPLSSCL